MKVLVLHQHYWPEIAPTGQLLQDICEDLVTKGHEVSVVCGQPSYRIIDGIPKRAAASEVLGGVRVRRVYSYVPEKRSVARRLVHYGSYFVSSLSAALATERPDVVMVMSTPPLLLGISGVVLDLLRRVPFVYSVQDLYPDVAIDLGVLREGPLFSAIDQVSAFLYRRASRVVTLSDAMAAKLRAKGVASERLVVIPNWSDTDSVRPLPRDNEFARAHGLAGKFVVQYSGNVGLSQGLECLIEAAALLRGEPAIFAIVGDGNARASLEVQAKQLGLTSIVFLPPQTRAVLPKVLASCDVGLVSMRRGVSTSLVPSKLYGILAAGRPVLAAVEPHSEVADVVSKHGCGLVVAPENADSLAQGIRDLMSRRSELPVFGQRGRLVSESLFSRRVCTGNYADVLESAARGTHTWKESPPHAADGVLFHSTR